MIMQLGPLTKIMGMFPGMSADMFPQGAEEDSQKTFKRMMRIMDSMTRKELDGDGKVFINEPTRVIRIAKVSGTIPEEVEAIFKSYRAMSEMVKKMGGKNGLLSAMGGGRGPAAGNLSSMVNPQNLQRMQQQMRQMNPDLMRRLGNIGNIDMNQMMQSFGSMFGN